MLHILWIIIKIILILIGILLGLALLMILLVLFCPFRYHATVEKYDDDLKKAKVKLSASWLFHGLWFRLQYGDGDFATKINVFGLPIHKILENKKNKNENKDVSDENYFDDIEEDYDDDIAEDLLEVSDGITNKKTGDSIVQKKPDNINRIKNVNDVTHNIEETDRRHLYEEESDQNSNGMILMGNEDITKNEDIKEDENSSENEEVISILQKIRNILDTISGKLKEVGQSGSMAEMFAEKINTAKEKVDGIIQKINWWKNFLTHPKVKSTWICVKNALMRILKHLIPTRLYGNVIMGWEDPSITGKVLALLGITMPFHKNCVKVTPLFDGKNVLTGNIQIKGRIYAAVILFHALKVLINKDVRYTFKYWKNKEES